MNVNKMCMLTKSLFVINYPQIVMNKNSEIMCIRADKIG